MTPLRDWPLRSHAEQASDLFAAERHRELAAFQDLYIGLAPGDAPAVFSLLQAIELAPPSDEASDCGIFYPLGPNPNPNPTPTLTLTLTLTNCGIFYPLGRRTRILTHPDAADEAEP